MSLTRLNYIVMSGVLPFNFGMDYESCLAFHEKNHKSMPSLCPVDPKTWSEETIDKVNKQAKEDNELCNRLMKLSKEDFYAEVDRLTTEKK